MEPVRSVLTQANFRPLSTIKPAPASSYDNADDPERRWEIVYGYGKDARKFLTDLERRVFLSELAQGKNVVQVGSLTLTNRFLYIAPLRDKPEKKEWELVEVDGRQVYREVEE